MTYTTDQWVIMLLVFVLGLLIGGFLFSGGGRKWKHRYNSEVERRRDLEKAHSENERSWREQDSRRETALREAERNRPVAVAPVAAAPVTAASAATTDPRDSNRDGVVTANEAAVSPVISDARDTNNDGVVDSGEAARAEGGLLRKKPARNADGTTTDSPIGGFMDKVLGRDRDRDADGVPDREE